MRARDLFPTAYLLAREPAISEPAIAEWFATATPREIAIAAAEARVGFLRGVWSDAVSLNHPLDDARLDAFGSHARLAIAAVLSLHRSGYVRELGLRALVRAGDPRVIPFLLLRADDIVTSIRVAAESALLPRLRPENAATFARSLGLTALLAARVRGGKGTLVQAIHAFLSAPEQRAVLSDAAADRDPVVRREVLALRLRDAGAESVLRAALLDRDTTIRWLAARSIAARTTSPDAKRALLPVLASARSPSMRGLALRAWHPVATDDAPFERALLDPNAGVRHIARTLLRARRPDRPFGETRDRALTVLADPAATALALVGALGALADVGLRSDADAVRALLRDERPRVRAEATRTLEWLSR